MTSAPASARNKLAIGPGSKVLKSSTRMPCKGAMLGVPAVDDVEIKTTTELASRVMQ
jgi:hypothetical protein